MLGWEIYETTAKAIIPCFPPSAGIILCYHYPESPRTTLTVLLFFQETANRFRQAKGHSMNLWMCTHVQYVHKHTHTHSHVHMTHTCSCVHSHKHSLSGDRHVLEISEFSVSTGGDQVISGLFYIQFDITCNIQHSTIHTLYILLCVDPIDDHG